MGVEITYRPAKVDLRVRGLQGYLAMFVLINDMAHIAKDKGSLQFNFIDGY